MSQTCFINPDALSKPPGYSHVVEASAPGRIVYIAGQLGVDREGKVVGDFRQQAIQTFENLKAALAAVGADFRQVVKLNNYLVDVGDLPTFREVRDSYLPTGDRPASTTIAISVSRARVRGSRSRRWRCCPRRDPNRRRRPHPSAPAQAAAARGYQGLAIETKVRSANTGSSTTADQAM